MATKNPRLVELQKAIYEERVIVEKLTKQGARDVMNEEEKRSLDEALDRADKIEKSEEYQKLCNEEYRATRAEEFLKRTAGQSSETERPRGRQTDPGRVRGSGATDEKPNDRGNDGQRSRETLRFEDDWSEQRRTIMESPEYRRASMSFLCRGAGSLSDEQRQMLEQAKQGSVFEGRAQSGVSVAEGGVLVAPLMATNVSEAQRVLIGCAEAGATLIQTESGAEWTQPALDYTGRRARIIGQNVTNSSDGGQNFFGIAIPTFEYTTDFIGIPKGLLQDAPAAEAYITKALAFELAAAAAYDSVLGTGGSQPEGICTAIARLGHTIATTGSGVIAASDLSAMVANVGDFYKGSPMCSFLWSRSFTWDKLVNFQATDGSPLFLDKNTQGPQSAVYGQKWKELTSMAEGTQVSLPHGGGSPTNVTVGGTSAQRYAQNAIVALYGDLTPYVWRLVRDIEVARYDQIESYVRKNCIAIVGRRRMGGGWASPSQGAQSRPMVALRVT